MRYYIIYIAVFAGYGLLFLMAGGLFFKAAEFLLRHVRIFRNVTNANGLKQALIAVFMMNLLAVLVTWNAVQKDTVSRGYLIRNDFGGLDVSETVDAKVQEKNGETREATLHLTIDPRTLTKEEKERWMEDALSRLPDQILRGQQSEYVTDDLYLPSSLKGDTIQLIWNISEPDIVNYDGTLGEHLSESGTDVALHALLTFTEDDSVTRDFYFNVKVFPGKMTENETIQEELENQIKRNNDPTEETVVLPDQVDGRSITWSKHPESDGIRIFLLGILLAACLIWKQSDQAHREQEYRKQSLLLDYPQIVSKLVLYLGAGMSSRKALFKMAAEYDEEKRQSKAAWHHDGRQEIIQAAHDMENGMMEREVYEKIGKRCDVAEYKALSNILIQNSMKGGRELMTMLRREADEAEELRRKNARRLGEEAGTKLLLPMLLLLVIVMAILMIPAIIQLQI